MTSKASPPTEHRVEMVETLPPPKERIPKTLYVLINKEKPERDRYLGAFMDRWSGLERRLLMLLWPLLGRDYATAEVLFYSATSIKTQTDMITGLIVLEPQDHAAEWRALAKRCLILSNNRNHLVHGHWIPEVAIDCDEEGNPVVGKMDWVRIYMTGDPDLNARAALKSGEPKTGQNRYPFERIRRKITQVAELDAAITEFTTRCFPARTRPEE